jgi:hypothetical protein
MRLAYILTMLWIILLAVNSVVHAGQSCNQLVYDKLYETLVRQAIETQDYTARADAIELLRKLCNNQPFTLELKNRGARTKNMLPVQE